MNALLLYSTLAALFTFTLVQALNFFPHGLEFETPVALTPAACNFFNSRNNQNQQKADSHVELRCADSVCSPLPQPAEVEAAQALRQGSKNGSVTSYVAHDRGNGTLSSKGPELQALCLDLLLLVL